MRRNLLVIFALLLGIMTLQAKPVDVSTAQRLGRNFIQHKAMFAKSATNDFDLAYTYRTGSGLATAYVFNFDGGFVIVAADDCSSPILGYSDRGHFDYETAPDGLRFMLSEISRGIETMMEQGSTAYGDIICRWKNLEAYGLMHPDRNFPVVGPLVQLKWNQDFPYNMYAPGGCPTGCVATAMAQLMKYWEWPVTGTGEHSYYAVGYGEQYANFGATTYDWDNMIEVYTSSATQEQKEAVATLMYHCGVSVNMMYEPDGSGAFSPDVPIAINSYFSYSEQAKHITKLGHTYDEWIALLKSNIDQQIPLYYSGQSSEGGHAFVCDGYDNDDLFYFNWGWGGSANGFFLIDGEHFDYSGSQAIIYDFIPNYVYDAMPKAPENLSVTIDNDISRIGHLTWINPSETMTGEPLTSLDKIIVKRNSIVVKEITDVVPGATMTYDDEVPFFDQFEYTILAVQGDNYGRSISTNAVFGPYCDWKVIMTSQSMQGWDGGGITVQNAAGSYIDFLTTTTSSAQIQVFQMALGNNNLYWTEPNSPIPNISFKVRDAENQLVYEYNGPSSDLEAGLLRTLNNTCGNENPCEAPTNLKATVDPENDLNVILTWESDYTPEFGYCIYRDGFLFNMAHELTYVDENTNIGGHCYYVTALCTGGETANSNEYCVTSGTGCEPPTDLYFNYFNGDKVQLFWSPSENENVTGYVVYRKTDDTPYKRIKNVGANATNCKDTSVVPGTSYQYVVTAYYRESDCNSAYATDLFDNEKFFVEVNWSNEQYYDSNPRLIAKVDEETRTVKLYWDAIYQTLDGKYSVIRDGIVLSHSVTDVTYADDDGLLPGGTYVYKVSAFAPEGDTGYWHEFTTNEVVVSFEPECPAPINFRLLSEPVDRVRLTWGINSEEGWPDSFIMTVIDHQTGDTTDITLPLSCNFTYEEEITHDGMDKSYKIKAVYSDCESEYGLTEEGEDFIRIHILPCSAPTDFSGQILAPNPETRIIRLEWQAPEDRVPESYTLVEVVSNCATELQGITDTFYEIEIPVDVVVDYTYMLYAIYPECVSEPALTADGDSLIHLTNLSVNEQSILNVKLYPNPTSGQLRIEAEAMTSVSVYDLVGQCMMQMPSNDGQVTLDMSQLQNGIYLIKVSTANGSMMQRVVKM